MSLRVAVDETIDELLPGQLRILQSQAGYRSSIDPWLLCAFARAGQRDRVLDLGCGNGIMPLLLVGRDGAQQAVGVELSAPMADRARRSVALNNLQTRITIVSGDVRGIAQLVPAQSVTLVVSNPPYRKPHQGRLAPEAERAAARHELAGGLHEFVRAAGWALGDRGRFCLVHIAERFTDVVTELRQASLEPKRLRLVHPRPGDPARLLLIEGCKGAAPGLVVEPPLTLYRAPRGAGCDGNRDYSAEVSALFGRER